MHRLRPALSTALFAGLIVTSALLAACGRDKSAPTSPDVEEEAMTIQLTSPAFQAGQAIPARHARRGDNLSPALAWSGAPAGVQSFALIVDDPDAPRGDWVHWVVYNLPADTASLPEGVTADSDLPAGAMQGKNDWGETRYGGPQPPSGTHRYLFKLYALDTTLSLPSGATKAQLLAAMEGHILARGQLMGTYSN